MGKQAETFNTTIRSLLAAARSAAPTADKLDLLTTLAPQALAVKGCSLLLLDGEGKKLLHAASHGLSERYLRKGLIEAEKSLPETIDGKLVKVKDAVNDERIQYPELAQQEHIASIMGAPITIKGSVAGTLRVYSRVSREFTTVEEEFLVTVAELAGLILEVEQTKLKEAAALSQTSLAMEKSHLLPIRDAVFAHPSEEELARLLDFYQIDWLYEPRSFPLKWEEGRITEMFTPDFYLPGLDLYIEVTTLKPELTRDKKRKVKRMHELYPDVKIKLLARHEYDLLLSKYGHGPLSGSKTRGAGQVLYGTERIQARVRQLAEEISRDYEGKRPLLIGVMKGVFIFMADLMRYLTVPAEVDFMAISYYEAKKGGAVRVTKDLDISPEGRNVLLVEDIVDTGMTLSFILAYLRTRKPASLAVCTLFDKNVRRLAGVELDYVGFELPEEFIIGYGLDAQEEYRNLPFVALLEDKPDAEEPHSGSPIG